MIDLGKYAVPVLSAYGVSLALIGVLVLVSWRQAVRTRSALRAVERAQSKEASPYA